MAAAKSYRRRSFGREIRAKPSGQTADPGASENLLGLQTTIIASDKENAQKLSIASSVAKQSENRMRGTKKYCCPVCVDIVNKKKNFRVIVSWTFACGNTDMLNVLKTLV